MTDEQLIEKIAEILFNQDFNKIDAWEIYDSVESIFMTHRPKLREKYLNWAKNEELRLKEPPYNPSSHD